MCIVWPVPIRKPSITAYKAFEKRNNEYYSIIRLTDKYDLGICGPFVQDTLYTANALVWNNTYYPASFHAFAQLNPCIEYAKSIPNTVICVVTLYAPLYREYHSHTDEKFRNQMICGLKMRIKYEINSRLLLTENHF